MESKNRLILGCGYLGLRVAKIWQAQGDTVFAVTRSESTAEDFRSRGIEPIVGDVTDPRSLSCLRELPKISTALIAIGMDRSRYSKVADVYVDGLQNVLDHLPETEQLIYVSSTGVYGDFDGDWVDENSPTQPKREGGIACLEAERLIQRNDSKNIAVANIAHRVILRFAGIYGPGRVPTKSLIESNDWKKLSSSGFLNLIHVDDGAYLIDEISRQLNDDDPSFDCFCVSDGNPVLRKEYYSFIAEQLGIDSIPWEETQADPTSARSGANKRVSNQKLNERFKFELQYPSYREGVRHSIENHGIG